MKVCVAQVRPFKGDIAQNVMNHKRLLLQAVTRGADLVIFPELSLTSYEPKLCKELATHQDDKRLNDFQVISDANRVTLGVGLPITSDSGILISMIIFQPNEERLTYSKQHLHADELPYFTNGWEDVFLNANDKRIAPAICYESLLEQHAANASKSGAEIYVASVAKSPRGVAKAFKHYPEVAKRYSMMVCMSNCIGSCDDFESAGQSSIWNKQGMLLGQLDDSREGILITDTETEETICLQY